MVLRRLTKVEKNEILEEFRLGASANELAKKYNCSANTINRTVKILLTEEEYNLLKGKRAKTKKSRFALSQSRKSDQESELLEKDNIKIEVSKKKGYEKFILESENINSFIQEDTEDSNFIPCESDKDNENNLHEIVPLASSFDFETQQQKVDCKDLDKVNLPESVYMLVDKKVELENQYISDLPEWSFLPEAELKRRVILLFLNQRSAKRNCSRNQKVIKIPNTDIFRISKPYLLEKGITRLIIEEDLISLDN